MTEPTTEEILTSAISVLESHGQDKMADAIRDVLDRITGFCAPHAKLDLDTLHLELDKMDIAIIGKAMKVAIQVWDAMEMTAEADQTHKTSLKIADEISRQKTAE